MRRLLLLVLLAWPVTSHAGAPAPGKGETVTIRYRLIGIICAGICNEYDVTVRPDGTVDYHGWGINHRRPKRLRFRLTPEEHARFLSLLRPARPVGKHGPPGNCEGEDRIPGKFMFDVSWRGEGPAGRLLLCVGHDALSEAIRMLKINTSYGYHWIKDEGEAAEAWLRDHPEER